jgi:hypothetical protein
VVEVLHAPHPKLLGLLLVGGEHFCVKCMIMSEETEAITEERNPHQIAQIKTRTQCSSSAPNNKNTSSKSPMSRLPDVAHSIWSPGVSKGRTPFHLKPMSLHQVKPAQACPEYSPT